MSVCKRERDLEREREPLTWRRCLTTGLPFSVHFPILPVGRR